MSAGMTGAESVQYYPPLPGDPSLNHYNPHPGKTLPGGPQLRDCSAGGDCAAGFSQEALMFQQAPDVTLFSCS